MKIKKIMVIMFIATVNFTVNNFIIFSYAQVTKKAQDDLTEEIQKREVKYKADNLRDPFQATLEEPAVKNVEELKPENKSLMEPVKTVSPPSLSIEGVIWGGPLPQAIVNNQIVKVGDILSDGVSISEINKQGITVFYQGSTFNYTSPAISSAINDNPDLKRRD